MILRDRYCWGLFEPPKRVKKIKIFLERVRGQRLLVIWGVQKTISISLGKDFFKLPEMIAQEPLNGCIPGHMVKNRRINNRLYTICRSSIVFVIFVFRRGFLRDPQDGLRDQRRPSPRVEAFELGLHRRLLLGVRQLFRPLLQIALQSGNYSTINCRSALS